MWERVAQLQVSRQSASAAQREAATHQSPVAMWQVMEQTVEVFDHARDGDASEQAFQAWRIAHPRGFVINRNGRSLLLHHADCSHFFDANAGVSNTGKPKICSTDRSELDRWAEEQGVARLPGCRDCKLD